jgi:hypothetical protein
MTNLILLICVVLASTSFVSYTAQDIAAAGYGQNWAGDVCWAAPFACGNPHLMAYGAAGFAGLWLVMKFVSALRG